MQTFIDDLGSKVAVTRQASFALASAFSTSLDVVGGSQGALSRTTEKLRCS